jgi:hypothetical protein
MLYTVFDNKPPMVKLGTPELLFKLTSNVILPLRRYTPFVLSILPGIRLKVDPALYIPIIASSGDICPVLANTFKVIKLAGQILADVFTLITSVLKGDWQSFGQALINIFKRTWNAIIEVLSLGLKTVGNVVGGFVNIFDKDLTLFQVSEAFESFEENC